jgi:hypothetical protein
MPHVPQFAHIRFGELQAQHPLHINRPRFAQLNLRDHRGLRGAVDHAFSTIADFMLNRQVLSIFTV